MKKLSNISRIFVLSILLFLSVIPFKVFAQEAPTLGGVAVNVQINEEVRDGDIVAVSKDGFKKATKEYDPGTFGVVVVAPIIAVEEKKENTKGVITNGEVQVRVSNKNGEIKAGDFIATSETAGVGVKATNAGYILGKALADFSGDEGLIPVAVDIGYFANGGGSGAASAIGKLVDALSSPDKFPTIMRYVFGGALGVVTLLLAAYAFVRFMSTGIEAIGRNPLARSTIVGGMVLSGVVLSAVSIAGIVAAFAIIRLGS